MFQICNAMNCKEKKAPALGDATQFNKEPYKTSYLVTHNKISILENQFFLQFSFL